MRFKTILFDLDGTLIESGPAILMAIRSMQKKLGLEILPDEKLSRLIGPPINAGFREFLGLNGVDLIRAVELYRAEYERISLPMVKPYNGVAQMLNAIKEKGGFIGVVTSKLHKAAVMNLKHTGLINFIDYIHGAQDEANGADKRLLLEQTLSDLEISDTLKTQTVMAGDRYYDLMGAKSVGISTVGAAYGYGQRQELIDCKPLYVAETVEDLERFLLA